MKESKIKVGITHGDINGVGYEVILKTLVDARILEMCTPIIYGSPKVAAYHRKAIGVDNINMNIITAAKDAHHSRVNIINCVDEGIKVELGQESIVAGDASFKALEQAVDNLLDNSIDVLVTAPVNKHSVYSNQVDCKGHTEYLEQRLESKGAMTILCGEYIKVGTAAGHVPMSELSSTITLDNILSKLRIMSDSLKNDFMISKPRIAVLGFNPHLGDRGMWGEEEESVIIPAIEKARKEGILALGPFSADGFFASASFRQYDAVFAMYHDQGMIPFKTIEGNTGVVYTAGISAVRTAPAHGVAYGKVGKGTATEAGFRNALYLALDIFRNRKINAEISKNPLPKYVIAPNPHGADPNVEDLGIVENK
jgi:4-hydroxythreonine-4-phosphate dehydrogenase